MLRRVSCEWRPGYAIRFASTLPDSSSDSTEGQSYDSTAREGTEGGQWRPGQPIVFGEGPAQGSRQVKAGRITAHRKGKGKVIEKQLLAGTAGFPNSATPTPRDTSTHSSTLLTLPSRSTHSWPLSHRWKPPSSSVSSRSSLSDLSFGCRAHSSPMRSDARVSNRLRSAGELTFTDGEGDELETDSVEYGSFDAVDESGIGCVKTGVQAGSPQTQSPWQAPPSPSPPRSFRRVPSLSQAELDDLLSGVDFADDSSELDSPDLFSPPTLTPRGAAPTLSQPEVEDLLVGIDFTQDIVISDEEDGSEQMFHSAVVSPLPKLTSSLLRPAPSPSLVDFASSPKIILRDSTNHSPVPAPSLPAEPDVFTLPSSSQPSPRAPFLPKANISPRPRKSTASSQPFANFPLRSSSSQPSISPPLPTPPCAAPFHPRLYSTPPSSGRASDDGDDALPSPAKLRGWGSVIEVNESSPGGSSAASDDSVVVVEQVPKSRMAYVPKSLRLKTPTKAERENKLVASSQAPRGGWFTRPAPASSAASFSAGSPPSLVSAPKQVRSTSSGKPITATTSTSAAPIRAAFKGRDAEKRYRAAAKQHRLRQKWPEVFDYRKWGGKDVELIYTTDEAVVERALATMTGPLGFDLEWDPYVWKDGKGVQGKTALVQVCDEKTILLAHVARMKAFPEALRDLVEDPARIKLGVQIAGDGYKLERDFNYRPQGLLELSTVGRKYDLQNFVGRRGLVSLQELVGIYLDRFLSKDSKVRCGTWSEPLSTDQVDYAANDVYSSLHVLLAIQSLAAATHGVAADTLLLASSRPEHWLPVADLQTHRAIPNATGQSGTTYALGALPTPGVAASSSSTPLPSLPPRQLEAYVLFQIHKLSINDIAITMSKSNPIKAFSVLWTLLTSYASLRRKGETAAWDEHRLVEAVERLGSLWTGKIVTEHGALVEEMRSRLRLEVEDVTRRRAWVRAALALAGCFLCFVLLRSGHGGAPGQIHLAKWSDDESASSHPNFDFDSHLEATSQTPGEFEEMDEEAEHRAAEKELVVETTDDGAEPDEELEEDVLEDDASEELSYPPPTTARRQTADMTYSGRPFLPFTCEPCSTVSPFHASPPTCAKYRQSGPFPASETNPSSRQSPFQPGILDNSVLFPGTGEEVRRVLKRAMKSSLLGVKRVREDEEADTTKFEDEEPFRILVLGGSVSNCRGVDPKTSCWHSHLLRWFQQNLPMEGDRDLVPTQRSLLFTDQSAGPLRLDATRNRVKRSFVPSTPPSTLPDRRLAKRAPPSTKKKNKKKKTTIKKTLSVSSRRKPSTKLINGSKSATGSAFFAYCFDEEMSLRRKNVDWGKGPDLIVLEYGVNDVYPHDEVAMRDFEKLLRTLRSLPSNPALVILEAASLLLASMTSFTSNAEYLHLPAAQFYDVPILSAKQAIFGAIPALAHPTSPTTAKLKMEDLFLPDQHHPSERGHEFLADILISFLEQQACLAQSEILRSAGTRSRAKDLVPPGGATVDPELDVGKRKEETVRPLPLRSLFTPFPTKSKHEEKWELPPPKCIQVGNSKTTLEPVRNSGWSKYAWARDKQYLVADKPGASVTYRVDVGKGGAIMADWLRSRFYDLGDVAVYLDNDRSSSVSLAGYWNLGWSIGVPTEIFTNVVAGMHEVTFEVLPASKSSHPSKKTNFRLIGLIST
ncbi:hypothetical protein JCM21900_005887 [Sporobolomyces salmonicolor]